MVIPLSLSISLSIFSKPCCSSISSSCCCCRSSSSSSSFCCPVVKLIVRRTFLRQEGVVNERLRIFLFSFSVIGALSPHQFIATAQYMRRCCWCAAFFISFYFFVVAFVVAGFIDYSVFARLPFGGGGLHAESQRSGNPGLECCSRGWCWCCCWHCCCCCCSVSSCGTVVAAADATDDTTSRAGAHKAIFVEHLLMLLSSLLQKPQLTFQLLFALQQSTAASLQYCSFTLRLRLRLQLPFLLSSWFQFQSHYRCGRTWPWSCSRFWSWFCFWLLSSCCR